MLSLIFQSSFSLTHTSSTLVTDVHPEPKIHVSVLDIFTIQRQEEEKKEREYRRQVTFGLIG